MRVHMYLFLVCLISSHLAFANHSSCESSLLPQSNSPQKGIEILLEKGNWIDSLHKVSAPDRFYLRALYEHFSHHTNAQELAFNDLIALKNLTTALELNEWIKSKYHVLVAFHFLSESQNIGLNQSLRQTHAAFFQSPPTSERPLTSSFEKETRSSRFSTLLRPSNLSTEQALHLTPDQMMDKLWGDEEVLPNSLAPWFLGTASVEAGDVAEIKSHFYDLSVKDTLNAMKSIASELGEQNGFHMHLVRDFVYSQSVQYLEEFGLWHKHVSDYVTLYGLENGLQPNDMTKITKVNQVNTGPRTHWRKLAPASVPKWESLIDKFLSIGIRMVLPNAYGVYGENKSANRIVVGLELRDIARTLPELDLLATKIASSYSNDVWKNSYVSQQEDDPRLYLLSERAEIDQILQMELDNIPEFSDSRIQERLNLMSRSLLTIGLMKFEAAKYFDYHSKEFKKPSASQKLRIVQARQQFMTDIRMDFKNTIDLINKGETVSTEELQGAIRMSLATWAKKARASELYSRF